MATVDKTVQKTNEQWYAWLWPFHCDCNSTVHNNQYTFSN